MVDLSAIIAKVAANTTITGSVLELVKGLVAQVKDLSEQLVAAGVDNATIQALADQLDANDKALADAVAANTPAAPPAPAPAPAPDPVADPAPVDPADVP